MLSYKKIDITMDCVSTTCETSGQTDVFPGEIRLDFYFVEIVYVTKLTAKPNRKILDDSAYHIFPQSQSRNEFGGVYLVLF